ncbi:hypothetical protein DXJ75_24875 [Vibrio parahaemolyticus]|nr:hypothetical protein DXJ75_24875 [Vibrio parahaemolyticus]
MHQNVLDFQQNPHVSHAGLVIKTINFQRYFCRSLHL